MRVEMDRANERLTDGTGPQQVAELRAMIVGLQRLLELRSQLDQALSNTMRGAMHASDQEEHALHLADQARLLGRVQLMEEIETLTEWRRTLQEEACQEVVQLQAHLRAARGMLGSLEDAQRELLEHLQRVEESASTVEDSLCDMSDPLMGAELSEGPSLVESEEISARGGSAGQAGRTQR
jgi:hypothetical protein